MKISHISTDKLLRMAEEQGSVSRVKRTWGFREGIEGDIVLMPNSGPVLQLFRGQTKRHTPCFPSIARGIIKNHVVRLSELPRSACMQLIANLIRSSWYCAELDRHPAFLDWSEGQGRVTKKTKIELAQHYGVPSSLIDLTESLEIALFFATHEFVEGIPHPCREGTGILYRLSWPPNYAEHLWRFRPVAIAPFARSFRQFAWSCELTIGECFEYCPGLIAVEFDHNEDFANEIRKRAEANGPLIPDDPMVKVVEYLKNTKLFPMLIAKQVLTRVCSDPAGLPHESEESILSALNNEGFMFSDSISPLIGEELKITLASMWESERPHWDALFVDGYDQWITKDV